LTPALTHHGTPHTATVTESAGIEERRPEVGDDMTVEVALAVMAGARVAYLTVCDGDHQSIGSITQVRLAVLRESSAYTDRMRLRDVLDASPSSAGGRSGGAGVPGAPALSF